MNAKRSILTHDMNDIMVMIQVAQANVLKYTKSYLWVSYLWVILFKNLPSVLQVLFN